MAPNLHGLRRKITAAALIKRAAWRTTRLPGGTGLVRRTAARLDTGGETTDSYRGLMSQLLNETAHPDTGTKPTYDPVAGIIPGTPEPLPDPDQLSDAAYTRPTAGRHLAAAAAYRGPTVADFDAAIRHYEVAHRISSEDLRATEGLLTVGGRSHFDWPRIWRSIAVLKPRTGALAATTFWDAVGRIFRQDPTEDTVNHAVEVLGAHAADIHRLHQLLIEAISVRLQMLGRFRTGFTLREAMARNRVDELAGIPLESSLWLKHLLGAHAYLGQHSEITALTQRPPVDRISARVSTQVEKLSTDAALFSGDDQPLVAHAQMRRAEMALPGDERMEELVSGKRVAVVGPAATPDQLGELIDSYDTVVRTKLPVAANAEQEAAVGVRTDIAYYAGRDLIRDYERLNVAAESGDLQMAVARPFFLQSKLLRELDEQPRWLRSARCEYGLYFRGAPLGIQRIIYDLLQFTPAEIGLFHADFYAGTQTARSGYRSDYGAFGPYTDTNDIVMVHDLAYEFRCLQAFLGTGRITPYGTTAEVLELDCARYIDRLEQGVLAPRLGTR